MRKNIYGRLNGKKRLAIFSLCLLMSGATVASPSKQPEEINDGWKTQSAQRAGWDTALLNELDEKINQNEFKKMTSVLIAHKGKLVFENYYNNGHRGYMNDLRSATKSITSTLLGIAKDQGKVKDLEQPIVSFFPEKQPLENADSRKNNITIKDLLTMSSLLECNDDNPFSRGNEERMYIYHDWVKFVLDLPVKGFAPWEPKPEESPFKRSFSYCTAGSFLLGAIVEKATNKEMREFSKQQLELPLKINQVKWNLSPRGITSGAGGTRYTSRDFLKFGELFRNKGRWQGKQIISANWVEEATKSYAQVRDNVEYGYQWWRFKFPVGEKQMWSFAASGNGGNYLFVLPELELVALITSEAYSTRYMHQQSQKLYRDFILKAHPKGASH